MMEAIRRTQAGNPRHEPLLILIPIYNDWDAVSMLLVGLDRVLTEAGLVARVLLVDDGSSVPLDEAIGRRPYLAVERIDVLALRRNVGHQRAIAIALAHVYEHIRPGAVVIMDGDGEDAPEDVPRLVASLEASGRKVIFAERRRRSESLVFRAFYGAYRFAHLLLTGIPVRVGNFSIVPALQLERLVVVSELWNHYAAAVFKARLPRETIPTERAKRLTGQSTMNFVALVGHGLSALSVHAELIGVRLLVAAIALVTVLCLLLAAVLGIRLATSLAIPGWATTVAGILLILLFQAAAFAVCFVFLVLHGRSRRSSRCAIIRTSWRVFEPSAMQPAMPHPPRSLPVWCSKHE
jgi:polyisoprenyl-phosphate glycosyltransferase